MNDKELERIIDYLKKEKGWSDEEIIKLLHYMASGKLNNTHRALATL